MAIIFEDKQVERSVVDVQRSPGFRRLRQHVQDEANDPSGNPLRLADALAASFREKLIEGIVDESPAVVR